jgi:tripartite-type tricarboxylate transporter receptor subunit TctC
MRRCIPKLLVGLGIGSLALTLAVAAPAEESGLSGLKQINLQIGYPPGGGYDAYGRLLARHMGRHLPGNPAIVVSNVPGAGSIILANNLYNRAPRDGSVLGVVAGDAALDPLFGHPEAHYDALKFSWIGSMNEETSTCFAWHTSPVQSIEDALHRAFIVGTSSSTGTTYSYPTASNTLLGTKFKIVSGYDGTNGAMLAVERGELEGMCGTAWNSIRTARPQWLSQKLIRIILQEATRRNPDLAEVPTVMDIAKTDRQKQVLQLIYGWQIMGRPIVAPPGLPAERLAGLRTAFEETMHDPVFLADAEKMMLDIRLVGPAEMMTFLTGVYKTPKDVVEEASTALGRHKGK